MKQLIKQIVNEEIQKLRTEDIGWDNLPNGWDEDSLDSFARSLTDKTKNDSEGFFTACMDEVEDKMDEPEAFCASLKDEYLGTTDWRGESANRQKLTKRKLQEIVQEEVVQELAGGSEVYSYRWNFPVGEKAPDGTIENYAHFESKDGLSYKIKLGGWENREGTGYTMRVDFGTRSMGDELTGGGEPFKILGTIAEAVREAVSAHGDVQRLEVSAAGKKRQRIYDKLLKSKIPNITQVDKGN